MCQLDPLDASTSFQVITKLFDMMERDIILKDDDT